MGCRVLCLTLFTLLSGCLGQQCILITPNVLRLESEETIVVDGQDKAFEAEVEIHDFPKRSWFLAKQKISINNGNQFLGTATVKIPPYELTKDPKEKKYVYVLVKSPVCNLEKIVLLSNQNKYAFIQTDKTTYTPGSNVLYRIFSMNYKMSPPVNTSLVIEFLTPEKVFVKREEAIIDESGIVSSSHRLSEVASFGVWTISAKFKDFSGQIYTTNFGVKEFVPPTYEITLIPEKKYFYVDDTEFSVKIEAKFIHGDPVNGKALVIFGINKDSAKTSLPNTMKWIMINEGEGMAQLLRKDLVSNFINDEDMLECTLYMSITLITGSGSDIVESELEGIHIVKSPYKVLFTRTSKYFKPTMPFDLMVFVTNPDGSPATKVPVVAEPGMVLGRTGEEGTARMTLNTNNKNSLQITVRTADPALPGERQATASMEANAYWSLGNYLYIGISPPEVTHGDIVTVKFFVQNSNPASQNQIQHLTYLIMSKGSILKVGRQPKLQGQDLVTMSLPITEEFIPSFRIVAYYMVGNEIVSDSLHVDVTDSEQCIGTVLVTGDSNSDNGVQVPGARMRLKLQADHKAYVGLVAIDKGLNVLNRKFKMSQKKVWDTIGKSDLGCTPGSGTNSMGVFYDAGLALQSSFQTTTPERSEPQCAVHGFRKRRSFNDGEDFIPDNEIFSRANFPESWLWKIVQMTEKPDKNGLSTTMLNVFLKDSITTWEVLAVSLSPNKGICVAKPHEIQVKTQLFTDLKVPYSVVINEQVEIQAIIYNNGHQNIKARVTLTHNPAYCSLSTAKRNYQQIVDIKAQSSVSVPFTLIPLSLGSHDIEVKASGNFVSDGVKKKLKVVVTSMYYAIETESEKKCNNFDLTVKIKDEPDVKKPEGVKSTVSMHVCVKYLREQDATMSIIDITLMTGFVPDTNQLNQLKSGVDKYISRYEIKKGAFDRGTLVLYLDKVSHTEEECLAFNLHQYFDVGLIQPGSVTVYDYYSPERRCTKFYHVDEKSILHGKICVGDVCRCAEENCFLQLKLDKVTALARVNEACAPGVDYAYKGTLENIDKDKNNYYNYVMKIKTVIKQGTDIVTVNDRRHFISHAKCKEVLNLKVGLDYVVWGMGKDLWHINSEYAYLLTKDTWIEMWPNDRECHKDEYFDLCEEFENFQEELEVRGCLN